MFHLVWRSSQPQVRKQHLDSLWFFWNKIVINITGRTCVNPTTFRKNGLTVHPLYLCWRRRVKRMKIWNLGSLWCFSAGGVCGCRVVARSGGIVARMASVKPISSKISQNQNDEGKFLTIKCLFFRLLCCDFHLSTIMTNVNLGWL